MDSIQIKVVYGALVKRYSVDVALMPHATLCTEFQALFGLEKAIRFGYVDEDGDKVLIANDAELQEYWATVDKDDAAPPPRFFVTGSARQSSTSETVQDPIDAPLPDDSSPPQPQPDVQAVREAFTRFTESIEGHRETVYATLDDLIRQASTAADQAAHLAHLSRHHGQDFGYNVRRGVEDFLAGLFDGLNGLHERHARGRPPMHSPPPPPPPPPHHHHHPHPAHPPPPPHHRRPGHRRPNGPGRMPGEMPGPPPFNMDPARPWSMLGRLFGPAPHEAGWLPPHLRAARDAANWHSSDDEENLHGARRRHGRGDRHAHRERNAPREVIDPGWD